MESFKDFNVTWVHCGDKITVILTDSGDVYAIGSTYGSKPVRLQSSQPCVFCTCGVGTVYALDCNGDIFSCTTATGKGVVNHLPEPICDIAAGSTFCLAVSVSGRAYAKGNDSACGCGATQPSDNFMPISSLLEVKISRVVAYSSHSIAIARDWRVFVCGTTTDGRIGVEPTPVPLSSFQQLHSLDGLNIIGADCGDAHSLFLTKDGHIYGCGYSTDGRTFAGKSDPFSCPRKSDLSNVSYVRCGCFHSVAFVGMKRPVHPGLLFFGLLVGSIRKPKNVSISPSLIADISLRSVSSYGLLTGDTVAISGNQNGTVVGVVGDKICVRVGSELQIFKKNMLKFLSRGNDELIPQTTISGKHILVDTNPQLCAAFGLKPGDKVKCEQHGEGKVVGFANGTIWFSFGKGYISRVKENGISGIFKTITLLSSSRQFKNIKCEGGVIYPIEKTHQEDVETPVGYGEVIGTIGNYLCVRDYSTATTQLFEKSKCSTIRSNKQFTQHDVVKTPEGRSFVTNTFTNAILTISEQSLLENCQAQLHTGPTELIARAVGRGTRRYVDPRGVTHLLDVSVTSIQEFKSKVYPGDIYATRGGFVEALGLEQGRVVVADEAGYVTDFTSGTLVSRSASPCKKTFDIKGNGRIELSVYTWNFRGLRFLPGDEISVHGESYIVLGARDNYLWIRSVENSDLIKCVQPAMLGNTSKLVSRPTKRSELFLIN